MAEPVPAVTRPRIVVLGASRGTARDLYHWFLRARWWAALAAIVAAFLAANALFAGAYVLTGGVCNVHEPRYLDVFFFSVQTMGTIGYGDMHPTTTTANVLMVAEAVSGMLFSAVATGLVFAKVAQPTARILFTREIVISPIDGVPTLQLRLGNERENEILEAHLRLTIVRREVSAEGIVLYRMHDLPLVRDRSPAFTRSWTVMHTIDTSSLLFGATPELLREQRAEFLVSLVGTDDTSLQPMHARHTYEHHRIRWGARHADILGEGEGQTWVIDLGRFHDVVATSPTATFPYPARLDEP